MTLRIGSFCTGYGGLDAAVQQVFGGELAWVSDSDPGPTAILAHHYPAVPNLGDLTETDWARVLDEHGPVDIVCGGYPCQPFSLAGRLRGTADERHIWPYIAGALRVLRPRYAIFENVANHLRLGFADVLADLARLGFDAQWCLARASEVGAPHARQRLFLVARAADAAGPRRPGPGVPGRVAHRGHAAADPDHIGSAGTRHAGREPERHPEGHDPAVEDANGAARCERRQPASGQAEGRRSRADVGGRGGTPAPDATCLRRREGWPEPAGQQGRPGAAVSGGAASADADRDAVRQQSVAELGRDRATVVESARSDPATHSDRHGREEQQRSEPGMGTRADADRRSPQRWGRFAPAIARWEAATGRPAPWATDHHGRLSPSFVEWMMGLPAGHVTAVPGLTRTQQLKALGNGVVPQQASAAIRLLVERAETAVAS